MSMYRTRKRDIVAFFIWFLALIMGFYFTIFSNCTGTGCEIPAEVWEDIKAFQVSQQYTGDGDLK